MVYLQNTQEVSLHKTDHSLCGTKEQFGSLFGRALPPSRDEDTLIHHREKGHGSIFDIPRGLQGSLEIQATKGVSGVPRVLKT